MSKILEVGDVLYESSRWHGIVRHVIDKVTPKQAKAGETTFVREPISYGQYKMVGGYGGTPIETPALAEKYRVQEFYNDAYRKLKGFNVSKYSEDQLRRIIAIIDEPKQTP